MDDGIVIVGGGLAGQRCAETLRREGYDGPVRVVCSEPRRPYDRPPLSKGLLAGRHEVGSLAFRAPDWYARNSVELLLGVAATGLRAAERKVELSDGSSLAYEQLLIATGGRPRPLPTLTGYDNVSVLRTLDDALVLRDVLGRRGERLALVGAGFVGLEIASTARALGLEVTIVEAAPSPLHGVLGPILGSWFARLHEDEGVTVLSGRTIERLEAGRGAVRALHLSDGHVVAADHVVVGVGTDADVGWLAGSGIETTAGVPVDADGRSRLPRVFAAGDAAATFDPSLRRHLPGSHWEAAARQAARAARTMLGLEPVPAPAPSFWTDQYGLRIQYVGRSSATDSIAIDGELGSRNFAATFSRAGRAVAVLLVDRPRNLPAARQLIERGTP